MKLRNGKNTVKISADENLKNYLLIPLEKREKDKRVLTQMFYQTPPELMPTNFTLERVLMILPHIEIIYDSD